LASDKTFMLFISYNFLVFFLIVFVLYWCIPEQRWQNILLLISSLVFYGWLIQWHVVFLLVSILFDYFLALGMARWRSNAVLLMRAGVVINIAILIAVKYYFLFNASLADWFRQLGLSGDVFLARIILPLGVSFYVLKKISYLIEVGKGSLPQTRNFITYATYISYFPQVFSGPLDRPQNLIRQLETSRSWKASDFYQAWPLILMGLFKKLVIANTVKVIVDQMFIMKEPSKVFLLVGAMGFTLQILADFSSYTDLSRGISFLLGLETMKNFNRPYLALMPADFWNRWHISFSSWLRDYIFFPLRRMILKWNSFPQILAVSIPVLVTMLISGLWHGIGMNFVIWGLYYGLLGVVYQYIGLRGDWHPTNKFGHFVAWLVMFFFIVTGWLIFRSPSMAWLWQAVAYGPFYRTLQELITAGILMLMIAFYALPLIAGYLIERYHPDQVNLRALYYAAATILVILYTNSSSPDFIYFQF